MQGDFKRSQAPGHALPIIVFHGDQDMTVHPAAADELIAQGAQALSKASVVEPGRVPDGHAYTRTLHHRDDGNVHAEQWMVHGGGHAWFGGNAGGSYTDKRGPDASREMLRFFRTRR
jgi:poly(3-hydroxybutyrate) depolymerase